MTRQNAVITRQDYMAMTFEQLCHHAGVGDEEVDFLEDVEKEASGIPQAKFLLDKVRRVLAEAAAWLIDKDKATAAKNWDWCSDCADALEELVDEYLAIMDRIYDYFTRLTARHGRATGA